MFILEISLTISLKNPKNYKQKHYIKNELKKNQFIRVKLSVEIINLNRLSR